MSGATGEGLESVNGEDRFSSNRLEPQDILLAHEILHRVDRPLSWQELNDEFLTCQQGGDWQALKHAFCRSKVVGFVVCEDFISLDTVEMIALLKLMLLVAVCEKFKSGRLCKISFVVNATFTEEEKRYFGRDPTALANVISKYKDIFTFRVSSSFVNNVVGTSDKSLKFHSFFMHETSSPILSAIHKIKYFLNLCHGKSSTFTTFEFVQNFLTYCEKTSLGTTKKMCIAQIQAYKDDFSIYTDIVELLQPHRWHSQPRKAETVMMAAKMDDASSQASKTNNPLLQQEDILLFCKILKDGPLSWSDFADEYAKHMPSKSIKALQELIYQSPPNNFLYSPDFISLQSARSIALLKLQLIVVVNNRLQNGQLGKISYHFNIAASDSEREYFGRNSQQLDKSLQKLPEIFSFPDVRGTQRQVLREVKPSSQTLLFHSFFSAEGDNKASFIHKLQYFINLCGGKTSAFSLYEFARNLLKASEKTFFKNENSFVQTISNLHSQFQVIDDEVKLHSQNLWCHELKKGTETSKFQDQADNDKIHTSPPQPAEVLTADFVKNILNNYARYPMDWDEFKTKFMKSNQNADAMVANFLQSCPQKALKSLCFSSDFLALNTPFHRNRLKLQLILAIRKRSTKSSLIALADFQTQFEEIASDQEIEQTQISCDDFGGFLEKFPKVFIIQKNTYVEQGREALQFSSFFQHEKDSPLVSVVHKLNYFVYLCGDYCSISLVCRFLQKHLKLKRELELVNSDEKVLALIQNCESGALNLDQEEDDKTNFREMDSSSQASKTNNPLLQQEDILLFCKILKDGPLSWSDFADEYAKHMPSKSIKALQELIYQSPPNNFLYSPDFISLQSARSIALLKLQLIVVVNNRLQNGQLGKISYHFNIAASDSEREYFGRNSQQLDKSLQKLPEIFSFPDVRGTQRQVLREVKPSSQTLLFNSFFIAEGDNKASFIHKLQYFINLCGGKTSAFSLYEFARNLLKASEKTFFKNENSFVQTISNLHSQFQVIDDEVKLHSQNLWCHKLKKGTETSKFQDQADNDKIQTSPPQPAEVLTADFVKNILNNYARHPMDWDEFKTKFMKSHQNADAMVANFLQSCPQKALKSLCFSSDFLALNTPFHRNRLKLQLILAIRKRSTKSSLIALADFQKQFEEIASDQEIEQTQISCDDFRGFLEKFPKVFIIQKNTYVKQGREALQFSSFFQHEKDSPLVSVVHKLNYFVYLCGDYCSISLVCKFLQKHLKLKRELELVNSDEKVLALIQNCESGALNLDQEEDDTTNFREMESDEERKATAAERAREVEKILDKQDYPISWRHFENLCFANNKSKEWVTKFRQHYLPVLESNSFLFSREFISFNSSYDRAFLKICLLVTLFTNKKGQCDFQYLVKQFLDIASGIEKGNFCGDIKKHLANCPLVFKLETKSSGKCHVSPGKDMVSFSDFFMCEEHGKEDCLCCQIRFYMKVCSGRCHYQKCHRFVNILRNLNQENDKTVKNMSTQEMEDFIQKCGIVKDEENPDVYVILKPAVTSRSDEVIKKDRQASEPSTEGNSQLLPITQEKTTSSSISKENVPSAAPMKDPQSTTPSKDPHPSPVTQEAENPPLNSTAVSPASSGNNNSNQEISTVVKVKIVRNDKILKQVIDRMLKLERPIISMAYCEDALVILNWERKGFVIPFKKTDLASGSNGAIAEKWSLLAGFMQNPNVTQVTFDCEAIGTFLLENFNLQLNDTVFDVKIGAELLPSELNPTSATNVADLCSHLKLPSLDKVDVQIVGDLIPKQGEMVCLEESTVVKAVREASVLIPGVYGKMFEFLEEMDALKTLHSLTGDKLQSLYNLNMDNLLPLDRYYPSEIPDSEEAKQSSSPSSISTSSSIPVSSLNLSARTSSKVSSVDLAARSQPSGVSDEKILTDDWFSADSSGLLNFPTGMKEMYNPSQYFMKPSLVGTPSLSYSHPKETLSSQPPDFEQSMIQDHPLSLCKGEGGSIIQVPVEEAYIYDRNLSGITAELVSLFAAKQKESMRELLLLLGMDIFETIRGHFKEDFCDSFNQLTDIVLDLGRNAEARLFRQTKEETPEVMVASGRNVTSQDLAQIEQSDVLTGFGDDNRCGIEGALHSLRQVRNKKRKMVGLTVRVHKPLLGCADMMYDVALDGKCTLVMGYSGVGKTTLLRELARCLNDSAKRRVIVIDTFNEVAGDYDIPHFSIGGARRLQVDSHENQHQTLLESAKNHSPEVLIVDKVENQKDVAAVIKLCQQGIQVIAGVDGESVSNLFNDKNLCQLFQNGGDNRLDDSVSLDSAGALAKSKARPAFDALVEMVGCNRWYVHDLAHTYNCCMSGQPYSVQERTRIGFTPGLVKDQQIVLQEKLISL